MPKILIFENEDFLRDMYVTKYRMEAFEVADYKDPTKNPIKIVLREKPDIISTDIIMPVMNGFDALKLIKADPRTRHIPVYILSNLGQQADIDKGLELGATAYLVKAQHTPIEVVNAARKILGLPIPPEKPTPPPGEAWHGESVVDLPLDKPKSWWQKLFS